MIKFCGNVLVVVKFVQHTRDHDHETMWHASQ
jgi:hypothetical protein